MIKGVIWQVVISGSHWDSVPRAILSRGEGLVPHLPHQSWVKTCSQVG